MIKLVNLLKETLESSQINPNKKLIVYHGTGSKFKRFNLKNSTMGNIWFTSNKTSIINKTGGADSHGYIITAEVTINNPAGWDEYEKKSLGELKRDNFDGAILPKEHNQFDCFVFNSKQIKILKVEKV